MAVDGPLMRMGRNWGFRMNKEFSREMIDYLKRAISALDTREQCVCALDDIVTALSILRDSIEQGRHDYEIESMWRKIWNIYRMIGL